MILEDIARANSALSDPKALAAFVDVAKGRGAEDAYLKHVCGIDYMFTAGIPPALKESVKLASNVKEFYDKLYRQLCNPFYNLLCSPFGTPRVTIDPNWPDFNSFYKPLMDAGLLNGKYKVTENGKKLSEALDTLLE
jgi:hypothetical protein